MNRNFRNFNKNIHRLTGSHVLHRKATKRTFPQNPQDSVSSSSFNSIRDKNLEESPVQNAENSIRIAAAIKAAGGDGQLCAFCGSPRWAHYNLLRHRFVSGPSRGPEQFEEQRTNDDRGANGKRIAMLGGDAAEGCSQERSTSFADSSGLSGRSGTTDISARGIGKRSKSIRLSVERWGAMWRSKNKADGLSVHLIFEDCLPVLFVKKREAQKYIEEKFGYIRNRKDLRAEPHGWRMPKPIKVIVCAAHAELVAGKI